jgi:hypothetical protein
MAVNTMVKAKKQSGTVSRNPFAGQVEQPTQNAGRDSIGEQLRSMEPARFRTETGTKTRWRRVEFVGVEIRLVITPATEEAQHCLSRATCGMVYGGLYPGRQGSHCGREKQTPAYVRKMIAEAKRYREGTPVRIEVSKPEDLEPVKILAKIKVQN